MAQRGPSAEAAGAWRAFDGRSPEADARAREERQAGLVGAVVAARRSLLGALLAIPFTGCAALAPPRSIEVPEARLREVVGERFPIERRLLDIVDLRVARPRLRLDAAADRVGIDLDVRIAERIAGATYDGVLASSAALRFDAGDATLRLADVRVERFDLERVPAAWQRRIDQIGRPAVAALLEGAVVYRLPESTAGRLADLGLTVAGVHVTPRGLRIDLATSPP
ncbi:DUF1439 domain-containing protein [Piscinibacter koreensis]|uniref:DUF1439 domain-containing protein n=1 Tax=Piscinibacter koreensis TaxID=2742824 RepID=A0A7Y6TWF0_9BURK|nr:DUF1439 domain-containing protein [Schlegelella koreensis]NUZ06020.1 DUF1439 domain-containing protein [Schlegelella koreensis]